MASGKPQRTRSCSSTPALCKVFEVLTIGTDTWVQVVNDDARAQGEYRARRAWRRRTWKAERDKEKANKVAQQVKRAAVLTAELATQSEEKTAAVCGPR